MTHTLVLCFGIFLGICSQILEYEYPSLEACERERAAQMAAPSKPYYAVCRPGKRPAR